MGGLLLATCVVPLTVDPFGYNPFGPAKTLMLSVACVVMLSGMAFTGGLSSLRPAVRGSLPAMALALFVALTLLSTVVSIDPAQSLMGSYPDYQGVLSLLVYILASVVTMLLIRWDSDRYWLLLARSVTATVFVVCVLALLQRVGLDPVEYRWSANLARARSTLGNASNLGLFLVLALPLIADRVRRDRSVFWRGFACIGFVLGMVVLAWTSSRGAWFGIVFAAGAWLLLEGVRWTVRERVRAIAGVMLLLVVIGAGVALFSPSTLDRLAASSDLQGGTQRWRLSVWASSMQASLDSPILGWGPNTMRFVYPLYRSDDLAAESSDAQIVSDAHNVFVNTAVERGIPAAAVLGFWFASMMLVAWKRRRDSHPSSPLIVAASALTGGLIALQFHFLTLDTGPLLFCLAGVVMAHAEPAWSPARFARVNVSARSVVKSGGVWRTEQFGLWALAAVSLAMPAAMIGVVVSDRAIGEGMGFAQSGESWAATSARFELARRAAPWEPAMQWAEGRAAVTVVQRRSDEIALVEGVAALDTAAARLPHETRLEADRADLSLAAGLAFRQEEYFRDALARYESLLDRDPNNGVLWIGRGSALAGLGKWEQAIRSYERGIVLAQRSIPGWRNLAIAYEQVGRLDDAARSAQTGAVIEAEDMERGAPSRGAIAP